MWIILFYSGHNEICKPLCGEKCLAFSLSQMLISFARYKYLKESKWKLVSNDRLWSSLAISHIKFLVEVEFPSESRQFVKLFLGECPLSEHHFKPACRLMSVSLALNWALLGLLEMFFIYRYLHNHFQKRCNFKIRSKYINLHL